ncbi:MAG: ribulose-phosphate 3-epimerase [Methanobacteriota archaeon]
MKKSITHGPELKLIAPSIIAENQEELSALLNRIDGISPIYQLDIMDGEFVPTQSLDFDFMIPENDAHYEAHLMVARPREWLEKLDRIADTILFPIETSQDPKALIDEARKKGMRVGFVLNPDTPVSAVEPYLDDIDQMLVMTVNPGFYGAQFLPETLSKVSEIRQLKPNIDLEVDGGITADTIEVAAEAGANKFVSGSFVVKSEDPGKAVKNLLEKIGSGNWKN